MSDTLLKGIAERVVDGAVFTGNRVPRQQGAYSLYGYESLTAHRDDELRRFHVAVAFRDTKDGRSLYPDGRQWSNLVSWLARNQDYPELHDPEMYDMTRYDERLEVQAQVSGLLVARNVITTSGVTA